MPYNIMPSKIMTTTSMSQEFLLEKTKSNVISYSRLSSINEFDESSKNDLRTWMSAIGEIIYDHESNGSHFDYNPTNKLNQPEILRNDEFFEVWHSNGFISVGSGCFSISSEEKERKLLEIFENDLLTQDKIGYSLSRRNL